MTFEPTEWFVAFKRRSRSAITNLLPGRFKHVMAFAPLPSLGGWIFVEFSWRGGMAVVTVTDEDADRVLAVASRDAVVVKVRRGRAPLRHFGFWCVPFIAHVTGVRSCALRPDGFFRDCLRHGGEIVIGDDDGNGENRRRESSGARAEASAG